MKQIQYRRELWQLLTGMMCGNAAEIGVAEGNFSRDMLDWPIKFPRLFLVDRWKCVISQKGDASNSQVWHDNNLAEVKRKIAKEENRVMILRGDSVEMANKVPDDTLVLVYIDADHSYEGVTRDIRAWIPKLRSGGVMAFHDYENPAYGVKKAVQDFCKRNKLDIYLIPEDKPADAGAWFKWKGGEAC